MCTPGLCRRWWPSLTHEWNTGWNRGSHGAYHHHPSPPGVAGDVVDGDQVEAEVEVPPWTGDCPKPPSGCSDWRRCVGTGWLLCRRCCRLIWLFLQTAGRLAGIMEGNGLLESFILKYQTKQIIPANSPLSCVCIICVKSLLIVSCMQGVCPGHHYIPSQPHISCQHIIKKNII